MDIAALDPKEKFIHRDLSWLSFNERVLEEATDTSNPLLERLRFLAIFVNNLDEFFMVRVASLKRLLDSGYNKKDQFGYYPQDLFSDIKAKSDALIKHAYDIYKGKAKKELDKSDIIIKKFDELNNEQKRFVNKFFDTTLFPIVTPMAVDQGHPFPILPSKTMAFAISLNRGDKNFLAVIPVPKVISRVLKLPSVKDETSFILIEDIIRQNLANFFKGYKIVGDAIFRVIRDSELSVQEEYTPDLLKAIEDDIRKRPKAKIVYLEVEKTCSNELLDMLCGAIEFSKDEVQRLDDELDLTYLFDLVAQVSKPELTYRSFVPAKIAYENIFDKIKEGDILLHLPYQSFEPTADLIRQAAKDENVLGIKITLYRTDENSVIIKALMEAARNKKQVTALVEIKARFDEEKNIKWARELEEAGCHVIYGIPGLKIHSKMALIVRKEEGRIHRYVHLSTGNYNEKTARLYTDFGYFTANEDFAKDISDVFNVITGYSVPSRWRRIVSSPNDLRQYFFEMIDNEIECQKKTKNGFIFAKLNSLEDVQIIEKLYEASAAGVKIKLIVRGICCLIPGVPGMSETIEVKSIIGRFLEHSRVFLFNNNTNYRIFVASADWMRRNFDHRIELLFEIYKDDIKEHIKFILETCWKDKLKSRFLNEKRDYIRPETDGDKLSIHDVLISYYAG